MIEINNLTTIEIDEQFLKKIVEDVLKGEGIKKQVELSIALVGSGRMRKLNKKHRKKNRVTDVLAFPESEIVFEKFRIGPLKKVKGLGEIIICLREVKKNSRRFETSFEKELARVTIHGVLHLLGYEDEKGEEKAKEMGKKENYYLSKIKFDQTS